MAKPATPAVWASGKTFGFQPSASQQAQGFDYIATVRPDTGAPITDDHDFPLKQITTALAWLMGTGADGMLPKRSFTGNDYIRIPDEPGGLIIQWGEFNVDSGWVEATATGNTLKVWQAQKQVNLPIQFPTSHIACMASPVFSAQTLTWGPASAFVSGRNQSNVTVSVLSSFNPAGSMTIRYYSIGF